MLQTHMEAVENVLLEIAKVPANAGHSLHKGTPREAFIAEFLSDHLSESVAIGSGEIVDHSSKPGATRNQFDIVLYRRDFPRLAFGGGIHAFLVESVIATIEVKSTLDKDGMRQAMSAAKSVKSLTPSVTRSMSIGYQPPGILSCVVAYDGPASMSTVAGWLPDVTGELGLLYPPIPVDDQQRLAIASPALDAVFVLGKGFLQYQNSPIGFTPDASFRAEHPEMRWSLSDMQRGSLLLLFLQLTTSVSGVLASSLNPDPYLTQFKVESDRLKYTTGLPDLAVLAGGQWDTEARL